MAVLRRAIFLNVDPEIVAASAIQGKIVCPSWYLKPGVNKVIVGEGISDFIADKTPSIEDAPKQLNGKMENMIGAAEGAVDGSASPGATEDEILTDVLYGFPEKIEGEIVFRNNDNVNAVGIYPGRYTYQDGLTTEQIAKVCMENYDTEFGNIIKPNDVLVTGFNFGTFGCNGIDNVPLRIEIPKLVKQLREAYKDDAEKLPTRCAAYNLLWDVRRSKVTITELDGAS